MEAVKCGFDAITFDRSALPFEQNISETQQAVETLKSISPSLLVEGEIGEIGSGSEIHEEGASEPSPLTTPKEATQFVAATGVDILAPAVGNRHGLVKSMVWGKAKKHLDIALIARIKSAVGIPLTLHGGSGTDDVDLQDAITAGINIVHINTELRVAWRRGLEEGLAQDIYQVVPYKILPFCGGIRKTRSSFAVAIVQWPPPRDSERKLTSTKWCRSDPCLSRLRNRGHRS